MKLRLGLLDVSPLGLLLRPSESIAITRELASRADEAGFSRYWLAEHHTPDVAHSSPDLLVALLADTTEQIRIGVAGVLLRFRSPLSVAEGFGLLDAMYPGRIDVGLARGSGPEGVREALLDGRPAALDRAGFERRVEEVLAYFRNEGPVVSTPAAVAAPEVWLLGRGPDSAKFAGRLGLCFSQALFLPGGEQGPDVIDMYRQRFQPSGAVGEPRCNVAVAGFIAPTGDEADRLADGYPNSALRPALSGDPEAWGAYLADLRARYQVDEIIFVDLNSEAADRLRTVDLLAEAAILAKGHGDGRHIAGTRSLTGRRRSGVARTGQSQAEERFTADPSPQ